MLPDYLRVTALSLWYLANSRQRYSFLQTRTARELHIPSAGSTMPLCVRFVSLCPMFQLPSAPRRLGGCPFNLVPSISGMQCSMTSVHTTLHCIASPLPNTSAYASNSRATPVNCSLIWHICRVCSNSGQTSSEYQKNCS